MSEAIVKKLRDTVKGWQWDAEKLRRDARDLELRASTIFDRAITLDLIADKIEADLAEGEA